VKRLTRRVRGLRSRKRQTGAETVEFALTLILWFIVFMFVINMAVAFYNKSAMTNAERYALRQGTLFWVDPATWDDTTPIANKRIKRSMVETARDYWASTVLALGGDPVEIGPFRVVGPYCNCDFEANPNLAICTSVADANVTVGVSHEHAFIGWTGLLDVLGWTLGSEITAKSESRL
jgi:hypothetical protein